MEEVEYELLQIDVVSLEISESLLPVAVEEVLWHYSFLFSLGEYSADKSAVKINMELSLYRAEDPDKKNIVIIKIQTQFKVTRFISTEAKLHMLYRFLNITIWNLQGVYAAKTENSSLKSILPSEPPFRDGEKSLKLQINELWN